LEKRYWYVILTYILMQFSGVVGIPLLKLTGMFDQYPVRTATVMLLTYWTIISFILGLLIVLRLLRRDMSMRIEHAGTTVTVVWSVLGVFLAMV